MRHIIPISGKDSFATAILQIDQFPHVDYELVFNPVGFELPETLAWLDKVEIYLGRPIIRVGMNISDMPEWKSGFRPNINSRYCTRQGKLMPMEEYFEGEGMVYYGLRYDEPERIGYINKGKSELTPVYPLRIHKYGLEDVLNLVYSTGCQPPDFFWQLLKDMFVAELGLDFLQTNFTDWQLAQLFAWRIRQNCFNCFFMRRYEWVGLLHFHPDLFWGSVQEEEYIGDRDKQYYIIPGLPLRTLAKNRDEILDRHVRTTTSKMRKLYKIVEEKGQLFTDVMSFTSCGLLCGK